MTTPAKSIAESIRAGLSTWDYTTQLNAETILERLGTDGFTVVTQEYVDKVAQVVAELDAEHRPMWSSPQGGFVITPVAGKDPVGCSSCYSADGSWPCATHMLADDLRSL